MSFRKGVMLIVAGLFMAPLVHADNELSPTRYDLYSWKDGHEWNYSLIPADKSHMVDAEIKQANPAQGTSKMKAKLLDMREGDKITWQQRSEGGFVIPPNPVVEEIQDYANSVGVKVSVVH